MMDISFIDAILLAGIAYLLFINSKMDDRIKNMKISLDHMRKAMDLPEDPINDELRELIREGKEVKAVKKTREALGLSLVEGKKFPANNIASIKEISIITSLQSIFYFNLLIRIWHFLKDYQ